MGAIKLDKTNVARLLKQEHTERVIYRDSELPGFALAVGPQRSTWRYSYKPRGIHSATGKRPATVTITLASVQSLSPDEARKEAKRLHVMRELEGRDPRTERRQARQAHSAERLRTETCETACEVWALEIQAREQLSPRTRREVTTQCRLALEAMDMLQRPITAITGLTIERLVLQLHSQPGVARKRTRALHRFLRWSVRKEYLSADPWPELEAGEKPPPPGQRDRVLSLAELGAIWAATDWLMPTARDCLRLAMLTGCRVGEAAQITADQIDLEKSLWHLPASASKNKRAHTHPLWSRGAVALGR